jgi:hypothetical protein
VQQLFLQVLPHCHFQGMEQVVGTASALNIGGSSRLINIGTNSSISDLNIVPNDNAVRFDTFVTTATNK